MPDGAAAGAPAKGLLVSDRIESIRKMLQADGNDVFLQYSLGMEYVAAGRHEEADAAFRRCMEIDANYLAAYVEAGKNLRAAGDLAGAREVFSRGMELARQFGEQHTVDHVRQQLESLPQ